MQMQDFGEAIITISSLIFFFLIITGIESIFRLLMQLPNPVKPQNAHIDFQNISRQPRTAQETFFVEDGSHKRK